MSALDVIVRLARSVRPAIVPIATCVALLGGAPSGVAAQGCEVRAVALLNAVRRHDEDTLPALEGGSPWLDSARARDRSFGERADSLVRCFRFGTRSALALFAANLRDSGRRGIAGSPGAAAAAVPCDSTTALSPPQGTDDIPLIELTLKRHTDCRVSDLRGEIDQEIAAFERYVHLEVVVRSQLESYARSRRERATLMDDLDRLTRQPRLTAIIEAQGGQRAQVGALWSVRLSTRRNPTVALGALAAVRCVRLCEPDGLTALASYRWHDLAFIAGAEHGMGWGAADGRRAWGPVAGIRSRSWPNTVLQLGVTFSARSGLGLTVALPFD